MKAWFLRSERERLIAVRRLAQNNTGIQTRKFKWEQLKEATTDPQLWLLGIYAFSFSFCNNALGKFLGFLVLSFGYSQRQSLLMSMPVSAMALASMVSSGVLGSIFPRRRTLIVMLFLLLGVVGYSLLWKGDRDNKAMLLCGLYISSTFFGALVQMYALLSGNVAGHAKKSEVNATVVMLSRLGGLSGLRAYHGDEASRGYPTGQISALCLLCVSEGAFAALWYVLCLSQKNRR